jgi:hypothetical protein
MDVLSNLALRDGSPSTVPAALPTTPLRVTRGTHVQRALDKKTAENRGTWWSAVSFGMPAR